MKLTNTSTEITKEELKKNIPNAIFFDFSPDYEKQLLKEEIEHLEEMIKFLDE